jgi:biotin carboxyl carrier protein
MELIIRHGEREEKVHLQAHDDGSFAVRVGERSYQVDVAVAGRLTSLRLVGGDDDGRQYEVATRRLGHRGREAHGHATYEVSTYRGTFPVEVTDPLTRLAEESMTDGEGATTVTAYMPGRVVGVLVAEGDTVARGQGIVVLEAMKMKNEIQAETDGLVVKLYVTEGQAVEGGDPLFEIG